MLDAAGPEARPLTEQERGMTLPSPADFEQVVLPHLNAAHNLARWLVGDATLAEDVVQDAALRALSYFGSYRGGDGRAWLLRIVRNAAYGALAARPRSRTASLDDAGLTEDGESIARQVADPADDPEAVLVRREGFARLDQALAALPAELRECLVLRELEELSYKEVAHITGVPIGTVMSRLWRARQALMGSQAKGGTA
jgi:RNA polymerase sigma factor (sigma-70 family)